MKRIILYWLLLLVPTVVISVAAFRLLTHERDRIVEQARMAAATHAQVIADDLRLAVADVKDEMLQSLRNMSPESLAESLLEWEEDNPLVRNVFVWHPATGLRYPLEGAAATAEEQRFSARYEALFTGRITWSSATMGRAEETAAPPQVSQVPATQAQQEYNNAPFQGEQQAEPLYAQVQRLRDNREELRNLARGQSKGGKSGQTGNITPEPAFHVTDAGWIPWFTENRLFLLGWAGTKPDGLVYGVEMELMTLLSRLITAFPASSSDGTSYALLDGIGNVIHQTGPNDVTDLQSHLDLPLAPALPHWRLGVYAEKLPGDQAGKGFLLLSGMLLAIFMIAICCGGALLTWQAHRSALDARRKTTFVSNISHELKTPLTSIRMYAELLSEGRVTKKEKQAHYLHVIATESQRLTRLVNNVLDFSRLEQGRKNYRAEAFNLVAFLQQVVDTHRIRLSEAGLELHVDLPENGTTICFDRDALEQVLLNLFDNAIKYAASGKDLTLSLEKTACACRLRVMDRGPGVPAAHHARIFDKFHRVDDSLTAGQPGSGLGLSIARNLLRDQGGDLTYEPRQDGGSTFIVKLPLTQSGEGI